MGDEFKIKIQWLPGAILPVVTRRSSTAADLSNLLQFSCFANEKVYLFHNGEVLNPSMTLESQGIQMSDVVECKIVSQMDISETPSFEKHSIAREAARVLDMRIDKEGRKNEIEESDSDSSSDYDCYQFLMMEDNDLTTLNSISSEPLPIAWKNDEQNDISYECFKDEDKSKNKTQEGSATKKELKESFTC